MAILKDTACRSTKRALKREAVNEAELSPHNHSGSWLSCFLNDKVAVSETKMFGVATEQEGENPLF